MILIADLMNNQSDFLLMRSMQKLFVCGVTSNDLNLKL